MAPVKLAKDSPGGNVERNEERGRPVTNVVMCPSLSLSGAHRQNGLATVKCLNLRLLVHAEHERLVGRAEVKTDDVAHLVDEQRVLREPEGLDPMRLQRALRGLEKGAAEWSRLCAAHNLLKLAQVRS